MELFITVPAYFILTIYLVLQLLRFRYTSINLTEKLSRRHFKILFDVYEVEGLTVAYLI